ncbi:MAG: hypothetical protein EZS28_016194 [Streblomastix strix]|uniref:Uncharacterized protein n=1 Tax=Streblomastix strix TaxID=222440 RepID=A0A5J4W038_9EUKA|nr:MAG: hypothetical protein EZS28_016194 [Streblomastix strix]
MLKIPEKPGQIEPGLFGNFETPKFTTKMQTTIITEQFNAEDNIGKFLQTEHQPMLQDIEHQLTPRQVVSEKTAIIISRVLESITCTIIADIDFQALNIFAEKNAEAQRRKIQCLQLLPITNIPQYDQILGTNRSPIDKRGRENAFCEIAKRKWIEFELFQLVSKHNKLAFEQHYRLTLTWRSSDCIGRYRRYRNKTGYQRSRSRMYAKNNGQYDNAEKDEEQTDKEALNQNKDYRVNIIIQNIVEQNLDSQSLSSQSLIAPTWIEKELGTGPAHVGVQEKPMKERKR